MIYKVIPNFTLGIGHHGNFGYIPDPPEPPSDEYLEEHCPRCKHYKEVEQNGTIYADCDLPGCEFEEKESDE